MDFEELEQSVPEAAHNIDQRTRENLAELNGPMISFQAKLGRGFHD